MAVNERQLDRLLTELEPSLRDALLDAFEHQREGVDYVALEAAIEAYDVQGVEDALNLDEGSFAPYILAALSIYLRFGQAFAPMLAVRWTVDMRPAQDDAATAAKRMTDDTRQAVRQVVQDAMMDGGDRRAKARDITRRIRPLVGLSSSQVSAVELMRKRLMDGDPKAMREVLSGSGKRDKRYDPLIKRAIVEARAHQKKVTKAIETGAPYPEAKPVITPAKVDEITAAYAKRLQAKRAKDIAAAEVQQYAETAKWEVAQQAGDMEREWRHSAILEHARRDHLAMSGQKRRGADLFVMANGVGMRYAHDPRGGAANNASCRCRTRYRRVDGGL